MMGFFADPEEVARHQAAHDSMRHDIRRLFEELDADQSQALTLIFDSLTTSDSPQVIAAHMAGRLAVIRERKFKLCSACGVDHDADLANLTAEKCPTCGSSDPKLHPATQADGGEVSLCSDTYHDAAPPVEVPPHVQARRVVDAQANHEDEPTYTPIGSTAGLKQFEIDEMSLYNLDDARDESTGQLLYFICTLCTYKHSTIQDRKSRGPEKIGCLGCINKEKYG